LNDDVEDGVTLEAPGVQPEALQSNLKL